MLASQGHAQRIAQGHLALAAFLFPKGDGRLDLLRLQHHPLAAHPHQRHFERGQPLELLAGERFVAQGQFPIELHQRIHVEDALPHNVGRGFEFGPHAQPRAGLFPPGRHQHAKAAPFQQRPHLAQKSVGFAHRQSAGLGARRAQAFQDGRKELRGHAQPPQHPLWSAFEFAVEDFQGAAARLPYFFQGHQQAGIVVGLEHIVQRPVGRCRLIGLVVHLWRFQPETEAKGRLGGPAQLAHPLAPGLEQIAQGAAMIRCHLDSPILAPQRRPPRAGHARWRLAPPVQALPAPIAHGLIEQGFEKAIQQLVRRGR